MLNIYNRCNVKIVIFDHLSMKKEKKKRHVTVSL